MIRNLQDTFTIPLTQNQQAMVDERDWRWLRQYKWQACWNKSREAFDARRTTPRINGKRHAVFMHREILGLSRDDRREVDHINWNPLDNRRANLRIVDHRQNNSHRRHHSKYGVGVVRDNENRRDGRRATRFAAYVRVGADRVRLGPYDTPEEARTARAEYLVREAE